MLHPFRVRILSGFTFLSRRFSPGYDVAALQAARFAASPTGSHIEAQGNALELCYSHSEKCS